MRSGLMDGGLTVGQQRQQLVLFAHDRIASRRGCGQAIRSTSNRCASFENDARTLSSSAQCQQSSVWPGNCGSAKPGLSVSSYIRRVHLIPQLLNRDVSENEDPVINGGFSAIFGCGSSIYTLRPVARPALISDAT